ncbi:pilus (MSHA type) biogenesis protein MshL [Agarivorans sp. Toyoura001]|uniref:pilus (MSHA type) biogenesis protein MshL n=1 Tax=unclassified Agarivorans TaxID=2636026 RepID=UPI0010EFD5D4|nr:pilus (MSHA type) biogenesis protein MshL [Agarivorans sp. Toyoura001]GDY26471.1 pilus (MSHA type) biogenesis protein MshL [Agarivorans sp. Toyoura001]
MYIKRIFIGCVVVLVSACQSTSRPDPVEAKQAISEAQKPVPSTIKAPELPAEVQAELMPELGLQQGDLLQVEHRFDVNARNVDAKTFFPALIKGSPLSVAMHPGVEGKITLKLKEVTLKEAIDVVSDMYGYDVKRSGKILHVYPAGMRIETIPLNYLMLERYGYTRTRINSGGITGGDSDNNSSSNNSSNNSSSNNSSNNNNSSRNSNRSDSFNGTKIESATETRFWYELEETLRGMIGISMRRDRGNDTSYANDGRMVVVSPQAGLVTVRAFPDEIRTIKTFLAKSERNLQRQVILEAKIIEVTLSDGYQQGIDWTNAGDVIGSTEVLFNNTSQIPGDAISAILGGGGALTVTDGNFQAVVSLLQTQGDVNVLSSPRITASNNQKAVIKVGTDEYFVTDVSNTTISGTNPVTNPSVELTPFFSGVALDVTPQIDDNGQVLLHVHPSVTEVKEQRKVISFGSSSEQLDLPLAQSDIRETDTVIKANSGDVVVIGGLMSSKQEEIISKVPFIGSIPGLGELFTNKAISSKKTELVILIQPTVVTEDTWQIELQKSQDLLNTWYPEEN